MRRWARFKNLGGDVEKMNKMNIWFVFLVMTLIMVLMFTTSTVSAAKFCCECWDPTQTPEYICTMIDHSIIYPDALLCGEYCMGMAYAGHTVKGYDHLCCAGPIKKCYDSTNPEDGCCNGYGDCYDGTHAPDKCDKCYGGSWHSGWQCEGGECVPEASTLVLLATGLLCMAGYLGLRRKEN